jgi:hypothetical protein
VLRRHIDIVAPVNAKFASQRMAERQQIRDTNRVRSAPHDTHIKLTQVRPGPARGAGSTEPRGFGARMR